MTRRMQSRGIPPTLSVLILVLFGACTGRRAVFDGVLEEFLLAEAEAASALRDERPLQPLSLEPLDPTMLCQTPRDPCRDAPCHPEAGCIATNELEYECGPCPEGMLGDGNDCRWPRRVALNEIDYDQPGPDDAEFIELINLGDATVSLEGLVVLMLNGDNDQVYRRIQLGTLGELAPKALALIAGPSVEAPADVPQLRIQSAGFIQNGPDAIVLADQDGRELDALVYGGRLDGFDEEAHALGEDRGEGSLVRLEEGGAFVWTCRASPGLPNTEAFEEPCGL